MLVSFESLPTLVFSKEFVEKCSNLNLPEKVRERLYTFIRRLNKFGVGSPELLGVEMLSKQSDDVWVFKINNKDIDYFIKFSSQVKHQYSLKDIHIKDSVL